MFSVGLPLMGTGKEGGPGNPSRAQEGAGRSPSEEGAGEVCQFEGRGP